MVVKGGLAGLSIAKDLVTNPFIFSLFSVRKSLVGLEGKSMAPHWRETLLLHSAQATRSLT